MAITGGNWTAGDPPRNFAHPPAPRAVNAVAGEPVLKGGNLTSNLVVGQPVPEEIVIMINGRNLVDIITELQGA